MSKLPDHFMISETADAGLYDCRQPGWMHNPPLRYRYRFHHAQITNAHELKATLRAGSTTDLGGYPLFFVMANGEIVSFAAVLANPCDYLCAYRSDDRMSLANRIVGCDINWEDADLTCDISGERIPSAYAEDEHDMSLVANGGVINPDKENPL